MEKELILKLVEAGFTKAEINELTAENKETPTEEKPKATEEVKSEPAAVPDDGINELLKAFNELKDDLKRRSIVSDSYEMQDPRQTAENVLASVISPEFDPNVKTARRKTKNG